MSKSRSLLSRLVILFSFRNNNKLFVESQMLPLRDIYERLLYEIQSSHFEASSYRWAFFHLNLIHWASVGRGFQFESSLLFDYDDYDRECESEKMQQDITRFRSIAVSLERSRLRDNTKEDRRK